MKTGAHAGLHSCGIFGVKDDCRTRLCCSVHALFTSATRFRSSDEGHRLSAQVAPNASNTCALVESIWPTIDREDKIQVFGFLFLLFAYTIILVSKILYAKKVWHKEFNDENYAKDENILKMKDLIKKFDK